MPDIATRGSNSELTYQQGDNQISNPVTTITANTNLAGTHNRELLVVNNAVKVVLPVAATLEASLDVTDTGGDTIGWYVTVFNNSAGTVTINATDNSQTLNGSVANQTLAANESAKIGYDDASNEYFILSRSKGDDPYIIDATIQGTVVIGSNRYTGAAGGVSSTTETSAGFRCPVTGTLKNLYVYIPPGIIKTTDNDFVFTIKNVTTGLNGPTVTYASTATGEKSDLATDLVVTAGDILIAIHDLTAVATGVFTPVNFTWTFEIV